MRTTEEELVIDFQKGDDLAYATLYNRYKKQVYAFCFKMVMDEDNVKDIVQEVFLKMYEHRLQLAHPEHFRSWLFMIARNQCMTFYRDRRKNTTIDEDLNNELLQTDSLIRSIERSNEVEIVRAYINDLKPEYREVVVLREYQGLSYDEISEVIGSTVSAVKAKLFKARKELVEKLRPVFLERSDLK